MAPEVFFPEHTDGVNKVIYNVLKNTPKDSTVDFFNPLHSTHSLPLQWSDNVQIIPLMKQNFRFSRMEKLLQWLSSMKPFTGCQNIDYQGLAEKIKQVESDYDVIHLFTLTFAPLIDFLPKEIHKKIILSPIDCLSLLFSRRVRSEKNFIKKNLWRWERFKAYQFEKNYYQKYKTITFVSDIDKNFVEKSFKNQSQVFSLPNGVDTETFKPEEGAHKSLKNLKFIFTGNFGYRPNKETASFLIEKLFPLLQKKFKNCQLLLVGIAPTHEMLNKKSDNIIVTGEVPDLKPYLKEANFFLAPIPWGAGIKNKVLEAMALELPVLGSQVAYDGIIASGEERLSDLIISGEEAQSYVNKILKIIEDEKLYSKLAKDSRSYILDSFTWSKRSQAYFDLCAQISK